MSPITSHVLDTAKGCPAKGVNAVLELYQPNQHYKKLANSVTNADGRIPDLLPIDTVLDAGVYRLTFDTAAYFAASGAEGFYPSVSVMFEIRNPAEHYHIPLLLSPYGYSTYRGS